MVKRIQTEKQPDIVTGDSRIIALTIAIDGQPVPSTTIVTVALYAIKSTSRILVANNIATTYDATNNKWILTLTPAHTNALLENASNPLGGLKGDLAKLEIQVGNLGTVFSQNMTVAQGAVA